jgi:hypothetical protein
VAILGLGVVACSSDSANQLDAEAASIQLELTAVTTFGSTYRLGPATFDISGPVELSVDASGDDASLYVPVDPGLYEVTLRPDWVLQYLDRDGVATPMRATLLSTPVQEVEVAPFQSTPLVYAFRLGQSGLDIGIEVDELVPPGVDGIIVPESDGLFSVTLATDSVICCFQSETEAREAFPDLTLLLTGT